MSLEKYVLCDVLLLGCNPPSHSRDLILFFSAQVNVVSREEETQLHPPGSVCRLSRESRKVGIRSHFVLRGITKTSYHVVFIHITEGIGGDFIHKPTTDCSVILLLSENVISPSSEKIQPWKEIACLVQFSSCSTPSYAQTATVSSNAPGQTHPPRYARPTSLQS
ncbi:uncharacterized protein LOC104859283 [Fukomys damarensis]|uniref:uncharacterized protein LOC104859283 n=1 Tax=Fukomys damarensis TaxID=885580 RepID=UPI00053F8912|nr:uncharacterized protein LOC104859283 [Fukomys damarensis]